MVTHKVQIPRSRGANSDENALALPIVAVVRDQEMPRALLHAFSCLGFAAEVKPIAALKPDEAPVVITDGDHTVQREIAEALSSRGVTASLSVLKDALSWDDRLLSVSRDISSWPVDLSALAFRLGHSVVSRQAFGRPLPSAGLDGLSAVHMLGQSAAFCACMGRIRMCAQSDAPVLIGGETGTGKELSTQALHYLSERRDGPLVPLNCGAVPEGLFENELFGHAKGAYTDARNRYRGIVEQADGGTLFLDEVDTLTPRAQVVLLRFLQDFTYRPLGGETSRTADVRLVAASNRNIGELATQREFRADLLYRLNVLEIQVPPLRERAEDIELLCHHFAEKYQDKYRKVFHGFCAASMQWLKRHHWPGNIRELEHRIHRAVVLSPGPLLSVLDDNAGEGADDWGGQHGTDFKSAKAAAIAQFEKNYICGLLKACRGNVTEAASRAGKERRALGKLIKKHRIDRSQYTTS